jgi:hypothetical protein
MKPLLLIDLTKDNSQVIEIIEYAKFCPIFFFYKSEIFGGKLN